MFVDSKTLSVIAGNGGDGCSSFRREKFVPMGGPDGGDGGRGGDVILEVGRNLNTLLHLKHTKEIKGKRGSHGLGANKTGRCAEHTMVGVPPGTQVYDSSSGELIGDLVEIGQTMIVGRGGDGGRGNARFKSSQNHAPRRREDGWPGQRRGIRLELKLLADVGLVGLPNAGKSTLLSVISAATPKIAAYPFTTLAPNLGVVTHPGDEHSSFVVADIPGLIEGAHSGAGLGHQFLRHVERCRVLAHLVDLSVPEAIETDIATIRDELETYADTLGRRPWILVGSKLDAASDEALELLAACAKAHGVPAMSISAVAHQGLEALLYALAGYLEVDEDEA